jgi:predicted CXXCH cytochrome family protein
MYLKFNLATLFYAILIVHIVSYAAVKSDDYVGSKECISCHQDFHPEIVKGWLANLHHSDMKAVSVSDSIPGNFKSNSIFERQDIKFIIGHKRDRVIFIGYDFQVLPLMWSKNDTLWIERRKVDAATRCFGCHTTGYFISERKFVEPGIGCEACHGPGKKHVDAEGGEDTIVNPAKIDTNRNRMICGQCHSTGKDISGTYPFPVINGGTDSTIGGKVLLPFQPGQDLTLGFIDAKPVLAKKGQEYSSFVQAPEYYSKQLCTDCHDPHNNNGIRYMLTDTTNGLCLRCHEFSEDDLETHWGADQTVCWECHNYTHTH